MKWLESKDIGLVHRVNVKPLNSDLGEATPEGSVITVKLGPCCYCAKVVSFLDWQPLKRRREEHRK